MIPVANLLIAIGLVGIFESTIGSALFALILSWFQRKEANSKSTSLSQLKLDFLIPAHNEEKLIAKTLTALDHSKEFFILKSIAASETIPQIKIRVGLDHCTDKTEAIVSDWAKTHRTSVVAVKNRSSAGKWNILRQLVQESTADWIALVDVGSVWNEGLLSEALPYLNRADVIGIAPSYRQEKGNFLENLQWKFESFLKAIESKAGGPVSVHGATVLYRRKSLLQVFEKLNSGLWLNDDVVIPLTLRTHWPRHRIIYLSGKETGWVRDFGTKTDRPVEYGRRKRILLGNLQWIRSLYLGTFRSSLTVGLLASRRVFRTFWAYWLLAIAAGGTVHTLHFFQFKTEVLLLAFAVFGAFAFLPLTSGLNRIRAAFWAGLEIPYHLFTSTRNTPEKIWN